MWQEIEKRDIDLTNTREVNKVRDFLSRFDLTFEIDKLEYTVAFFRDNQIVATGSLSGEVLRNIAIDESMQGEGLNATIVSHLMAEAVKRNYFHYFIFTKPDKSQLFTSLGFNEIARVEPYSVLLESGMGSIQSFCDKLTKEADALPKGRRAALVMNCNPFTLGHKALIAKAAKENDAVIILVVSEENSVFPFNVRLRLIKEGLKEYPNVLVVPGGKYVISQATFPGYFTKGNDTLTAQTKLDATIFASYIAPALEVKKRYIGEEPYCATTRSYNAALQEVLPEHGIEVCIIPRVERGDKAISASRVRELIRQGTAESFDEIKTLVPASTFAFLQLPEALPIIQKIQKSFSRH